MRSAFASSDAYHCRRPNASRAAPVRSGNRNQAPAHPGSIDSNAAADAALALRSKQPSPLIDVRTRRVADVPRSWCRTVGPALGVARGAAADGSASGGWLQAVYRATLGGIAAAFGTSSVFGHVDLERG